MRNTIGNLVTLTLFGESHGEMIGCTLDGLAPGIKINTNTIDTFLKARRPQSKTETARVEEDHYKIVSGIFEGFTTGAPITILIPNENVRSTDYSKIATLARPSHADFTAHVKYDGFNDYRGGGHFSGRITAPLVAAGAIAMDALRQQGINIGTHIYRCGTVFDKPFDPLHPEVETLENKTYPTILDIEKDIEDEITKVKMNQDSIGGIIETAITGLGCSCGEPLFDSVESLIAKAMFSIGGIKGIEFGDGFGFADLVGSTANDNFRIEDNKVYTTSNHNGGINGGISNGMPILFKCAVKPTPSIAKEQLTIDFEKRTNETISIVGRHDPAIIRRICIVVTALSALTCLDLLALKKSNEYLG